MSMHRSYKNVIDITYEVSSDWKAKSKWSLKACMDPEVEGKHLIDFSAYEEVSKNLCDARQAVLKEGIRADELQAAVKFLSGYAMGLAAKYGETERAKEDLKVFTALWVEEV